MLSVGDNGPALDSAYFGPAAVAADADGNVYIADEYNNRVQEVAVSTHTQFGIAMTPAEQGVPGLPSRTTWSARTSRSWPGLETIMATAQRAQQQIDYLVSLPII